MLYKEVYKKLNKEQKAAVDEIEGPIMVVAGPGTGKTQVLSLRIANILEKTDTDPSSILCLTFTRSGVLAMRDRLNSYIGATSFNVTISTFHSFGIYIIEKYFHLLEFESVPKIIEDEESLLLLDEIFENYDLNISNRKVDKIKYFDNLNQLSSILKKHRMSYESFISIIDKEILFLKNDDSSISTRGESKGNLKKEIIKKIESLEKTKEFAGFYNIYENLKRENGLMDYNDVLEYTLYLVKEFEDVKNDIRENYLYVLVDEHQDSTGVQNEFLKSIWGDIEKPNIFVVGDDRQLIYGFSGANIDYFTSFKNDFPGAKIITLIENYRSTESILNLADSLLESSISSGKLKSNTSKGEQVTLSEFEYLRDEIIGAGLYFKNLIKKGVDPNEMAILLPRNNQVSIASKILKSLDLPIYDNSNISLFSLDESDSFIKILDLFSDPNNGVLLSQVILDKVSLVKPIDAHSFLKSFKNKDDLSLKDLINTSIESGLFASENSISNFGLKFSDLIQNLSQEKVSHIISVLGNEFFINNAKKHEELLKNIELVRSFIHLATSFEEKNKQISIYDFTNYIKKIREYKNNINIAGFKVNSGISVMTLHKSKGLEYDFVWVGHMNEEMLTSSKNYPFTLPEFVKNMEEERDEKVIKREIYVAITRSKKHCILSFSNKKNDGTSINLSSIIENIGRNNFDFITKEENEKNILTVDPLLYIKSSVSGTNQDIKDIQNFVSQRFEEVKVSVSMLNNFFECPWKWYFRSFLKIPETKSNSLIFGSTVHSTIEFILNNKNTKESDLKDFIINSFKKEGIFEKRKLNDFVLEAYNVVSNWINTHYKTVSKDYLSEKHIPIKDKRFPSLNIYGKIDLVEMVEDDNLVVTDFKTGKSKTKSTIEKLDKEGRLSSLLRQLAMYSYLIKEREGQSVLKSRLLFLEEDINDKNYLYETHIGGDIISLLIKDIKDYNELMKSGEWVHRDCNSTYQNKENSCEYCEMIKKVL
jgi:DNA helicase-2/ATP-dependent DNA helicase PcrA